MIELVILEYLKKNNSVGVYFEKPKKLEKSYILIEKTSSSKNNLINSATFAIKTIADTLYNAAKLNEEVKKQMNMIIYDTDLSKCKLNSDYNFTDTSTKEYRYQAVYDIFY